MLILLVLVILLLVLNILQLKSNRILRKSTLKISDNGFFMQAVRNRGKNY